MGFSKAGPLALGRHGTGAACGAIHESPAPRAYVGAAICRPPQTGVQALSSIPCAVPTPCAFATPILSFRPCRKERMRLAGVRKKRRFRGTFRRRGLRIVRPDRKRQGSFAPSPRPLSVGFADISPPWGESSSSPTATRFAGLAAGPIQPPPEPPPKTGGRSVYTGELPGNSSDGLRDSCAACAGSTRDRGGHAGGPMRASAPTVMTMV